MNERIYTFKDGRETIFDAEDVAMICQFNLQINPKGYVVMQKTLNRKHIQFLIHRYILNAPKGTLVDHINGDKLDNRKINLRLVNDSQNMRNAGKRGLLNNPASKYKGVNKDGAYWQVRIATDNGRKYIGHYKNEIEAAEAYNKAALKYHGEYAKFNIINN